jgi:hypothetical protein
MPDTLAEGHKAVRREDAVRELHDLLQPLDRLRWRGWARSYGSLRLEISLKGHFYKIYITRRLACLYKSFLAAFQRSLYCVTKHPPGLSMFLLSFLHQRGGFYP